MGIYDISEIRRVFEKGGNIAAYLREAEKKNKNTQTSIMYTYDMQAGSYIKLLDIEKERDHRARLGKKIAGVIADLQPRTMLDAGVGEATSLVNVLRNLETPPDVWAFDISVSRLLYARRFLAHNGYTANLFAGSINNIPLPDNSVDAVLTVHAVEPNGGSEMEILSELTRVCRRHLVMIEPSYELGSETTRARMEKHGYVKGLPDVLAKLGWKLDRFEKWEVDFNPENEAALIVASPINAAPENETALVSPLSRKPLKLVRGAYFSPEDGHVFPVIDGLPCLLTQNAILASHFETVEAGDE